MNAVQRGALLLSAHRCIVLYGLVFVLLGVPPTAEAETKRELHDFAEININQYFEPDEDLILSHDG